MKFWFSFLFFMFSNISGLYLRKFRALSPSIVRAISDDVKSEEAWQMVLSPNAFAVLRQKATEPPGFSEKNPGELEYELQRSLGTKYPKNGSYNCAGCGEPLYTASSKFDSGCGWPAFFEGIPGKVKEVPDSDGRRIEIVCSNCLGHLGHVFKGENFPTPTNARHCVNGISLTFKSDD